MKNSTVEVLQFFDRVDDLVAFQKWTQEELEGRGILIMIEDIKFIERIPYESEVDFFVNLKDGSVRTFRFFRKANNYSFEVKTLQEFELY